MSYKAVTHPRTKCFKKKSQQSKTTSTQPGQGLGKEIGPVQNEFSCCWFSHSTGQGQSSPSGAGPTHDPNEVMMRRDKDREAGWLWVVWNSSRCHSFGCSATALGWGCDAAQALFKPCCPLSWLPCAVRACPASTQEHNSTVGWQNSARLTPGGRMDQFVLQGYTKLQALNDRENTSSLTCTKARVELHKDVTPATEFPQAPFSARKGNNFLYLCLAEDSLSCLFLLREENSVDHRLHGCEGW